MALWCAAVNHMPGDLLLLLLTEKCRKKLFTTGLQNILKGQSGVFYQLPVKLSANVSSQLNFRLFVSYQLKCGPFVSCQECLEAAAADRSNWHHMVCTGVRRAEARREELWQDKTGSDRERGHLQHPRNQHLTLAATVTKTACQELGFSVTADAAPPRTDISGTVHCLSRQTKTTIVNPIQTLFQFFRRACSRTSRSLYISRFALTQRSSACCAGNRFSWGFWSMSQNPGTNLVRGVPG